MSVVISTLFLAQKTLVWVKYEVRAVGLTPGQETANNSPPLIPQEACVCVCASELWTSGNNVREITVRQVRPKISDSTDGKDLRSGLKDRWFVSRQRFRKSAPLLVREEAQQLKNKIACEQVSSWMCVNHNSEEMHSNYLTFYINTSDDTNLLSSQIVSQVKLALVVGLNNSTYVSWPGFVNLLPAEQECFRERWHRQAGLFK